MRKIILLLSLFILPLNAFELKRVILSANNNPYYIQFWPVVAPLWEAMGLQPTLALVAGEDCPIDKSIGDVIRFDPIPGVPEYLQAQMVRLLVPILFPDDACIISDIDILPISSSYYMEGAWKCPDNAFLVYRKSEGKERYPVSYVAAKGEVFRSMFGISTYGDIAKVVQQSARSGHGWDTDQIILYAYAKMWEKRGGKIVSLSSKGEKRLDRGHWNVDFANLDISQYVDCHCPRPYSTYKQSIDLVAEAILAQY